MKEGGKEQKVNLSILTHRPEKLLFLSTDRQSCSALYKQTEP